MGAAKNTPSRTLLHILSGHEEEINRISWSPDGQYLASSSFDKKVRIWGIQTGSQLTLEGHSAAVYDVSWSPDGRLLASCSQDKSILAWDMQTRNYLPYPVGRHNGNVYDLAWLLSSSAFLASCSEDQTIRVWGVDSQRRSSRAGVIGGNYSEVYCISPAPWGNILVSGSSHGPLRFWNASITSMGTSVEINEPLKVARTHKEAINSLAWSPDGQFLASGSEDRTVQVRYIKPQLVPEVLSVYTLEGHTGPITSVSFSSDGRLLASKSRDGLIGLWRTDTWELVDTIEAPASNGVFAGLAFHPSQPLLAAASEGDKVLQVWHLNIPALLGLEPPQPTVHYVNAKVVLAGDSGVGKTALGRALTGQPYIPTDSTHGRFVYPFKSDIVDLAADRQEQREIFLWDLAGQSGSRLVHQLHLPEAAVVMLIFSDMGGDPFTGIRYWGRALNTVQNKQVGSGWPVTKFLVEARTDSGRVSLGQGQIENILQEWGLNDYFFTSSKEDTNISKLAQAIEQAITWDLLPKVSSTELFQRIKAFLVERKESGYVIESSSNLYRAFLEYARLAEVPTNLQAQFETCIGHLDAQGLLRRLNFGGFVLLVPEKLEEYADALVREVRTKEDELGSIAEAEVLAGQFALPQNVRLKNRDEEKTLLFALVQDLLSYEIALRTETPAGGSYLVFPSEVMRQPLVMNDSQGKLNKTIVFTFEGPIINIYATLAVRLVHSGFFVKPELWQNCMIFSAPAGGICRCELSEPKPNEGKGELHLFFDANASEETRYYFETYVETHLEKFVGKGEFQRQRVYACPLCGEVPFSEGIIKAGRNRGKYLFECPIDGEVIDIRDREERLQQRPDPQVHEKMESSADAQRERAVARSVVLGKELIEHYDVYLSYNPHNENAANRLRSQLQEHGYYPWLVAWDSQPGLPTQSQIEARIRQVRAALVLISQHEMDRQLELEVGVMIDEFKKRDCPIIPVYLADAPHNPQLPPFLKGMASVDFRKQEPDPLQRLIKGIENKRV